MIRIASFLVFFIGAAFAFGAFYLARGSESDVPQIAQTPVAATAPAPEVPETPEAEKLYYLREIDFDQGDITVIYNGVGPDGSSVIVRDQAALRAAKDQVYVNTETTAGQLAGSIALSLAGANPEETVLQVFRRDSLIASVSCTNTACGSFADTPDVEHAGLLDNATPYQLVNDTFDDHGLYLETILAISENPNFMLLNQRPRNDFPANAITPKLTISLPTAVIQSAESFDRATFEANIRDAVNAQLPEGASIRVVDMQRLHPAYLADKDNGQFVTAGGQPIAFPDARFLPISVEISGIDTLSDAAYDAITAATLMEFDVDAQFEDFVTSRLQTTCVDCYFLKVDGPFYRSTRPTAQTSERYDLNYYDLREAP